MHVKKKERKKENEKNTKLAFIILSLV